MTSHNNSLMNGFLFAGVLLLIVALVAQASAGSTQTLIIPESGKYSHPPLQINSSMEPVILNKELSTVNQTGVYLIPTGSIILQSDDGINRVFDANGIQFLAVYDTGAHHTHTVPNGAFIDSEGNITHILSENVPVMTIIDATERGIATPTRQPVVASFSPMPQNGGDPPLKVQFSDYSQGTITGWNWSFGDGSGSDDQNPVHTYRVNGTYTVALTVRGPSGSDTFTWPECVTVGPKPPLARIGADPDRADYPPLTVTFTDTSMGDITGWLWNFGDGSTSAEQNPVHIYLEQGNYSVSLTVSGPAGTDTMEEPGFILVGPFAPVAHFEAIYTPQPAPCTVEFQQYSGGTITQWLWDFGDGITSAERKPVHTYQKDGNFTVALTVTGPAGTSTKIRPSFIHVGEPFFISAGPIGIHSAGETFAIAGNTNLPPGEDLDYYVFTSAFNPGGPRFGNPSNASGTIRIVSGSHGNNIWTFTLDTKEFRPDEYLVDLHSTTFNDVYGTFVFTLITGKRPPAGNPSSEIVTPTIQTSSAANGTVTPTTQSTPLPAMLVIPAIGCVMMFSAFIRRGRE